MTAVKHDRHFPRPQADLVRQLKFFLSFNLWAMYNENSRNELVNFTIYGHRKPCMSILTIYIKKSIMLQQGIIVELYYLEMSEMLNVIVEECK